jgi:antitoxin VapB
VSPCPSMALDIRDTETERLASEVAEMTGVSETAAVREALRERRDRVAPQSAGERRRPEGGLRHFLETEIWPQIPEEHLGGPPMTRAERAELLGYGPDDE